MTPLLLIVADDNAHMRWLVRATFRDRFTDVVEASDGWSCSSSSFTRR